MDIPGKPDFDLTGRIAVVTGAGSGMGAASAAALAGYGAQVALLDRNIDAATQVADAIGENATAYSCDIADEAQVIACIGKVRSELGLISIVHNNAAVNMGYGGGDQPAGSLPLEVWRKNMSVNLDGTFFVTKQVLADMLELKRGSIINTASIAGPFIGSQNTAYTASKGGVVGFTKALVIGYAGKGIRANAICPGMVTTPMSAPVLGDPLDRERYGTSIPVGRIGRPEDIGGLVVFLASDASAYVNGAIIPFDGGTALR
jgi:NAD(P)-dependent dehydrogenase (short-subunit alcohol dehydrogenase family)